MPPGTGIVVQGGYLRHRKRMVAQSVWEDMLRVLREQGWLPNDYVSADNPGTLGSAVFHDTLLEGVALKPIDYFPREGQGTKPTVNTLAINKGEGSPLEEFQMGGGSPAWSQEYTFHFAFYAVSDGAAEALFQDLFDRYEEIVEPRFITLFNYVAATPTPIVRMECESFAWTQASDQVSVSEAQLFFARLIITDYLDDTAPV